MWRRRLGTRGGVASAFRISETRVRAFARERRGGGVPVRGEEWIRGARIPSRRRGRARTRSRRDRGGAGEVRAGTRGGRDAPRRRVGGSSARAARAALGRATPGRQAHRRRAARRSRDARPPWRRPRAAERRRRRDAPRARWTRRGTARTRRPPSASPPRTSSRREASVLTRHRARAPPVRATRDGTFRAVASRSTPRGAVASRGAFGGSGLSCSGAANEPGRACAASRGRGARASRRVRAVASTENDATGWVRRRTKGVPRVVVAPRERGANRTRARRGICERGAAARATSVPTGAKKKSPGRMRTQSKSFGDEGHRSPYLLHAKQTLYHLSYAPLSRMRKQSPEDPRILETRRARNAAARRNPTFMTSAFVC